MANWQESVRDFFKRISEYLRRGSEKAGEWIDEQAAIARRVRAIRRLRAQQRQILEIIGSKVYTLHTRGKVRNKDILAECRRIDEILAHIERLRREIEEIKQKSKYEQVKLMEVEDESPIGEEDEATGSQVEGAEQAEQHSQTGEGAGDKGETGQADGSQEQGTEAPSIEQIGGEKQEPGSSE